MSSNWSFEHRTPVRLPESETVREHRARIALEDRKKAEQRELELAEQRSDANSPEARIRAWERVHQLKMPTDQSHPILDVIAVATRLTLAQVQDEQRARATHRGVPAKLV
jgi:hypothetical protein